MSLLHCSALWRVTFFQSDYTPVADGKNGVLGLLAAAVTGPGASAPSRGSAQTIMGAAEGCVPSETHSVNPEQCATAGAFMSASTAGSDAAGGVPAGPAAAATHGAAAAGAHRAGVSAALEAFGGGSAAAATGRGATAAATSAGLAAASSGHATAFGNDARIGNASVTTGPSLDRSAALHAHAAAVAAVDSTSEGISSVIARAAVGQVAASTYASVITVGSHATGGAASAAATGKAAAVDARADAVAGREDTVAGVPFEGTPTEQGAAAANGSRLLTAGNDSAYDLAGTSGNITGTCSQRAPS